MMMRAVPVIGELLAPSPAAKRRAVRRLRVGQGLQSALLALVLPAAILAFWTLAVHLQLMRPQILPSPATVWQTASDLLTGGDLVSALAVSMQRVLLGLAFGALLGFAVGAAMGSSSRVDAYIGPTIRAICQVPTIAWLPFFMLIFGIGEELKLALIAKACFLPVVVNTYAGMRAAPSSILEVADVLEFTRWQRLRLVTFPAALPLLAGGLRLALDHAWKALVVVEMVASAAGIGHLMAWSRTLFQLDAVFVTIAVIGIVGWAMDSVMRWIERLVSPWKFVR